MLSVALPAALGSQISNVIRSAIGAFHNAIRPTKAPEELLAVVDIREVEDRFLESGWVAHEPIFA
jgi:hypothetical protein